MRRFLTLISIAQIAALGTAAHAQPGPRDQAFRSAVHPVVSAAELQECLARVPATREWPPDFAETLRIQSPALVVEMSTSPECLPCAHLWNALSSLNRNYGIQARTIDVREAMVRSGRLGLPWVGHPVAWVRNVGDKSRMVPIAIGTDHPANLARNVYLAAKMLTGVRPAVGVRGMAKFTGIVGAVRAGRPKR